MWLLFITDIKYFKLPLSRLDEPVSSWPIIFELEFKRIDLAPRINDIFLICCLCLACSLITPMNACNIRGIINMGPFIATQIRFCNASCLSCYKKTWTWWQEKIFEKKEGLVSLTTGASGKQNIRPHKKTDYIYLKVNTNTCSVAYGIGLNESYSPMGRWGRNGSKH